MTSLEIIRIGFPLPPLSGFGRSVARQEIRTGIWTWLSGSALAMTLSLGAYSRIVTSPVCRLTGFTWISLFGSVSTIMSSLKEHFKNRAFHIIQVSLEALTSRTYLYPPLGVSYLITHPSLHPPVYSRILPCIILTVSVTLPMFLLTYVPQAVVLTLVNGPLGPINAVALVLSESTTIITYIAKAFLLQGALTDLFDATLVDKGQAALVSKGRELKSGDHREGVNKLGKSLMEPLNKISPAHIVEYLLLLPLNFIPLVGTATFLVAQGRKLGPSSHSRYFQLRGYDRLRQDQEIQRRLGGYIAFGTSAVALNLVPFASIFFTFTSTVGAALWAAEIEKENASHSSGEASVPNHDPKVKNGHYKES